jgi:hypothetical protein
VLGNGSDELIQMLAMLVADKEDKSICLMSFDPGFVMYKMIADFVGVDYAWRRKELKLIKDQIPNKNSPKQNAALRFSVPILYAHWEGFVKKSCELYLEYVAKKYLKPNEVNNPRGKPTRH